MSREARDWAWSQAVTPTQKLVLLALAEHANGGGGCWPSTARLRELTGLSERAIRNAIRELENLELLVCRQGRGKTSSRYSLRLAEGQQVPVSSGAPDAGQSGSRCPSEGQEVPVRGARGAGGTVIEPSVNRKRTKKGAAEPAVELPDWLDENLWSDFLDHRKAIKAPMTEVAKSRALSALGKLRAEGGDPQAVLEQSIVNKEKGTLPILKGN